MVQYVVVVVTTNGKATETEYFGPFLDKTKATTYAKIKRAKQVTSSRHPNANTAVYVSNLHSPTRP